MYNLSVCCVVCRHKACATADLQQHCHIRIQDTLGADFLVIRLKKLTDGFLAHGSCIEMQTLVKPLRCVHAEINRQTDGHMRAVLASVVKQYLPKRYSHFFLSSELHFYDWVGANSSMKRVLLQPYPL